MLLLLAFALVVICSLLLTAVLRPPSRPAAVLSVYLLGYANIVLAGEVSNTVLQLNNPFVWLGLHLVFAALAWLVWRRSGKPSLRAPFLDPDGRMLPARLENTWRRCPELWVLGLGVLFVFLFNALLIVVVPPNTNDSLSTHMSRIGYWMQHGSFFPWPTQRTWQVTYPVNMQLQMFWTVLFLGTDHLVEMAQWVGAVAGLAAAYGLGKLLGASRMQAAFAALILATFPEMILEASTTQNDLVAGTLFAAVLYLLFLGLRAHHSGSLVLSGLALGLALGTKQTLFFLLPGLAVVLLLILFRNRAAVLRPLLLWGTSAAASFLLLSAYMFAVNLVYFGHPLGPETAVSAQTAGMSGSSIPENLLYNTFRLSYQMIDPTGLPDPLTGYSFKLKALVVGKLLDRIGFDLEEPVAVGAGRQFKLRERYILNEDAGWYGPLFAFLVLPALFVQLAVGIRRKDLLRVAIFILFASFLLVNAALRPGWDPYQGRYFIPLVVVATPLAAFFFKPGKKRAPLRWGIVLLAITISAQTFFWSSGKPITGDESVWKVNRAFEMSRQSFYMRKPIRFIEENVPPDATMALLTYGSFHEYPFFGETFRRRLVPVYPPERMFDSEWLAEQGVDYVFVLRPGDGSAFPTNADFAPVAEVERWTLYARIR